MSRIACSVIIPSRNRRESLIQVLEALGRQTVPLSDLEVIVVLDGSSGGSAKALEAWQRHGGLPHLRCLTQPHRGQAAARTQGAEAAQGNILVFLDDDVMAEPGCLAAHLQRHRAEDSIVVLGDYPITHPSERASWYALMVWSWWEDRHHQRAQAGRIASFRDLCAGNVSLRRDDFFRVGGFDPAFSGYGGEDFDLGYRLLKAGVRFVHEPAARARHQHRGSPAQLLRNMRQEGRQDVLLGRKHPELRRGLRIMVRPQGARTIFAYPWAWAIAAAGARGLLPLCALVGLRSRWRWFLRKLRHYSYWCGVRDALGNWRALEAFCAGAPPVPELELDVTDGLPTQPPAIWVEGPSLIHVRAGGRLLGTLSIAEPIDGPVNPTLADHLVEQLEPALWMAYLEQARTQKVEAT